MMRNSPIISLLLLLQSTVTDAAGAEYASSENTPSGAEMGDLPTDKNESAGDVNVGQLSPVLTPLSQMKKRLLQHRIVNVEEAEDL